MSYKEFLRARKFTIGFAIVVVCIAILAAALGEHGKIQVDVSSFPTTHAQVAATQATDTTNVYGPGIRISHAERGLPFGVFFAVAGFVTAIFGMALACFLSTENSGHLEIAWTRPTSRIGYALRGMAVDMSAIVVAFAIALAVAAALVTTKGWWPYFFTPNAISNATPADTSLGLTAVRFVLYPLAWYALISAITASMRGGAGIVVGVTWAVASVLLALLAPHFAPATHALLLAVNHLNPFFYGTWGVSLVGSQIIAICGLLGIIVLGIGASLLQWRRLEA